MGLVVILFLLALPALAQNTKGDRPQSSGGGGTRRESRFKLFKKKNRTSKSPGSYGRARSRGASRASSARRESRPGKAIGGRLPRATSKPGNKQRAWRGDITGRRIRTKNTESAGSARNVFPQSGRYVNHSSTSERSARRSSGSRGRVRTRSVTGKSSNVYSQNWQYVHNPSKNPQRRQRTVSNRSTLARLNKLQGNPNGSPPGRKRKVIPRSASRSFIARKSTNIYANFPRPKRRTEKAYVGDIAGRKLRTKNYETPRPGISAPEFKPYAGRKRIGERPYRGPAAGSYRSATRTKPQAWTGDITGRRIRGRNFTSKRKVEGTPILGSRPRSATRTGVRSGVLPHQVPGKGITGLRKFQSRLRGRRNAQGGGSVSGRLWNNKQSAIPVRVPKSSAMAGYSGRIKGGRPLKGGGSVSGRLWNNNQSAIPVRVPKSSGMVGYSGRIKRGRPLKGGGSVSGRMWNNNQSAIPVRAPKSAAMGNYTGNIKAGRPLKGGGSVSGRVWNNKQSPIPVRAPKSTAMGNYTGNIRAGRPLKGGGSVSGKLWNNKESAIQGRIPPASAHKINGYPGKIRKYTLQPGFSDQGEEFTGYIRRPRFWKDYIKNPKSNENALKKKRPKSPVYAVDGYQVAVRTRKYVKNENAAEEATPKLKPSKTTMQVGELQIKVKQPAHGKKKNAPEDAIDGLTPSKETVKASQYAKGVRRTWKYIHNSSSAEEALRVREPGKAFARATDYQGNIKMQKFRFFEKNRALHPDAKFVKLNKNNVDGERDLLTNFKLWWARLFKKEETQPEHLKDKGHKPRYDKGEQGLWYD